MKKLIITLLAIAMLLSCVLVFSACASKPEMDLEKAAENLEDEDYIAVYSDDEDDLGAGIEERLYASNEDDSLTVIVYKDSKSAKLAYKAQKLSYDVQIDYYNIQIDTIENMLKQYEDDLDNDDIEEYEEELDELKEELEELKKNSVIGKSGNTVWYGTKAAVKDSKG